LEVTIFNFFNVTRVGPGFFCKVVQREAEVLAPLGQIMDPRFAVIFDASLPVGFTTAKTTIRMPAN
jgi:hypothetical protein